jgi:predicted DCC family thiol-disulfide oxidoreductase YuxK
MKNILIYDGYCHYCFLWIRIFAKYSSPYDITFIPASYPEAFKLKDAYGIRIDDRHSLIYIDQHRSQYFLYLEAVNAVFKNHTNKKYITRALGLIPKWLGKMSYIYLFSIPAKFSKSSTLCEVTLGRGKHHQKKGENNVNSKDS